MQFQARDSGACCPGLIEALIPRPGFPRRRRIPGLAALASLKQGPFPRWFPVRLKDSGACCPGLIEAENPRTTSAAALLWIPGLAALASLKREIRNIMRRPGSGFRGLLPWPH